MAGGKDWAAARAPTLADFEELADRPGGGCRASSAPCAATWSSAWRTSPRKRCCSELKLESPFDLMGLYHGVSLDKKSVMDLPRVPDMVFLYRRALLDYWAEGEETLGHLVTHVLVHEIGHHFGLSDADMAHIEDVG